MSSIESSPDYMRVSVEVPTPNIDTTKMMLNGIRGSRALRVAPVLPPTDPAEAPELFTMIEDEKQRLVPAVQRPHVRAFAQYSGSKLGERLITSIWRTPLFGDEVLDKYNWSRVESCLIMGGWLNASVLAINGRKIMPLYLMLRDKRADLVNFGPKTLGFLEHFASAVDTAIFNAGLAKN